MGVVYMMARIAYNCLATIWPFYLQFVVGFVPEAGTPTSPQLAIVPLVNYLSSTIFSIFFQQKFTQRLQSRTAPIVICVILITVASVPLAFLNDSWSTKWAIYPCASLQGIGTAILLNTSTSIISDVIGTDNTSSAFVYGVYSFMDKIANGFLISWLVAQYSDKAGPLKYIISIVPCLASFSALLSVWIATKFYSHKLAKMSLGSKLKPVKKTTPQE